MVCPSLPSPLPLLVTHFLSRLLVFRVFLTSRSVRRFLSIVGLFGPFSALCFQSSGSSNLAVACSAMMVYPPFLFSLVKCSSLPPLSLSGGPSRAHLLRPGRTLLLHAASPRRTEYLRRSEASWGCLFSWASETAFFPQPISLSGISAILFFE